MFGRMTATPLIRLDAGKSVDVAGAELLAATDHPQIALDPISHGGRAVPAGPE